MVDGRLTLSPRRSLAAALRRSIKFAAIPAHAFKTSALALVSPSISTAGNRRETRLMRFIIRSVFWLGLVYHAMPWGDGRLSDALPAAAPALVSLAATSSDVAAGQLARAMLRGALDVEMPAPAQAPALKPQPASLDTLTPEDRQAPWRGLRGRI
jgi:hypothetical protein